MEKQLHAIQFFVATRNVSPPGDLKILCAKHEYPITGKSFIKSIFPQVYQAQYESTCACMIFEMAAIIKDLYGNSSNRLEKIDTRMNF